MTELMDISSGSPKRFPPDGDIDIAIREAAARLRKIGIETSVSVEEMKWWFAVPTVHPQTGLEGIIKVPWLVVHELVEIDRWKRGGGRPSGPLPEREIECLAEHVGATEVELRLAAQEGDVGHLRNRIGDIEYWLVDELTPLSGDNRTRCEQVLATAKASRARLETDRGA